MDYAENKASGKDLVIETAAAIIPIKINNAELKYTAETAGFVISKTNKEFEKTHK